MNYLSYNIGNFFLKLLDISACQFYLYLFYTYIFYICIFHLFYIIDNNTILFIKFGISPNITFQY